MGNGAVLKPETGRKQIRSKGKRFSLQRTENYILNFAMRIAYLLPHLKTLYFRDYIMQCHDYVLYKGQLSQILGCVCRHVAFLRLHKILCHCRQTFIPGNLVCSHVVLHTFLT